eukprot:1152982-Pelagomonas_calceolata.AAC.8
MGKVGMNKGRAAHNCVGRLLTKSKEQILDERKKLMYTRRPVPIPRDRRIAKCCIVIPHWHNSINGVNGNDVTKQRSSRPWLLFRTNFKCSSGSLPQGEERKGKDYIAYLPTRVA